MRGHPWHFLLSGASAPFFFLSNVSALSASQFPHRLAALIPLLDAEALSGIQHCSLINAVANHNRFDISNRYRSKFQQFLQEDVIVERANLMLFIKKGKKIEE